MEGLDSGNYIKLVLLPGKSETIVKTWGPLGSNFLGNWHHVAFTLRMARQFSRSSSDPSVVITQAFFFLDGQRVDEASGAFILHNLKDDLVFESGLSEVYVGGTSPSTKDPNYRNVKAALDNFRMWWPSCPDPSDPTRCNPYGFLYPQMIDGFRSPSAGIRDSEVSLSDVAPAIQSNMFQVADFSEPGLLVQLTFDNGVDEGVVLTTSTWPGPDVCPETGDPVCDGCIPECIFSNCGIFDTDCVEAGASDPATQAQYAESGTCQCLNVDDCPKTVFGCMCPPDKGLHKACTSCTVGVCQGYQRAPQPPPPPVAPPCNYVYYDWDYNWNYVAVEVDLKNNGHCDQCDLESNPDCACLTGSDVNDEGVDECAAINECSMPSGTLGDQVEFFDRNGQPRGTRCTNGYGNSTSVVYVNSTSFVDSEGMTCEDYDRNKCWCNDADSYAVAVNGAQVHAQMVCCACRGGHREPCDTCDSFSTWGDRNGLANNGVCENEGLYGLQPPYSGTSYYGYWYSGGCAIGTDSEDCENSCDTDESKAKNNVCEDPSRSSDFSGDCEAGSDTQDCEGQSSVMNCQHRFNALQTVAEPSCHHSRIMTSEYLGQLSAQLLQAVC